ncbi:MAG: hypothetical protein V3S20_01035 [Dehalococcoidia bacterium]
MKIVVVWAISTLAGLILLAACGGGEWPPVVERPTVVETEEPAATTPAGETPTQAPTVERPTSGPERLDVPPVNCGPLITVEEVDDALGVTGQLASIIRFAGAEACSEALADDEDFFVRIEPGDPGDFEPGASVNGVSGQPVSDVGDEALWFGGDDAEGGGDVGGLSVRQNTSLGALYFRIFLGRPGLDSAAQLEIAKKLALSALPRFPGVEAGYVDNLLVKEEAGEWTRGEGLVATLSLFAGELEAAQVLRHPELGDFSGTGVIRMAREYLEDGPDAEAKTEIARLLEYLILSRERLEAMAGIGPPTAARGLWAISFGTARGAGDCATYWGAAGPCMTEAVSPELDEMFGPGKYVLWVPAESTQNTEGWTDEHLFWALEAMVDSAITYEARGDMPETYMMFTPFDSAYAQTDATGGELCSINLNKPMQQLDEDEFKQLIADEMEQCLLVIEEAEDPDDCILDLICDPSDYFLPWF